jgi:hypothetical protein
MAGYRAAAQVWVETPVEVRRTPVLLILMVVVGVLAVALDLHRNGLGAAAKAGTAMVVAGGAGLWWMGRRR